MPHLCTQAKQEGRAGLCSKGCNRHGSHSRACPVSIALSKAGLRSKALSRAGSPPLGHSHREVPSGWVRNANRRFWLTSLVLMMPTKAQLLRLLMLLMHTATTQVRFDRRQHECFAALCATIAVRACMLSRALCVAIPVRACTVRPAFVQHDAACSNITMDTTCHLGLCQSACLATDPLLPCMLMYVTSLKT